MGRFWDLLGHFWDPLGRFGDPSALQESPKGPEEQSAQRAGSGASLDAQGSLWGRFGYLLVDVWCILGPFS